MNRFLLLLFVATIAASLEAKTAFDTLIYTHHAHETRYKAGNCDVCHVSIVKSDKARDDNYASQKACAAIGCHDIKNHDSCFVCHTNANAATPPKPKREILFSHKIHMKLNGNKGQAAGQAFSGTDCKLCHACIDSMSYFTRKGMPPMDQCISCHKNRNVDVDCSFCHTDRTIVRSHRMEGAVGHGDLYYKAPRSCERCHENNHCDKCHKGQTAVDVHPRNYLYLHQFDVFSGRIECEACHDLHQSCDGCHVKSWGRIVDHRSAINGTQSCKSCHRGKLAQ